MGGVYAGIDLHSNNNVVVVIDEEDRVLYGRRLANELSEVLSALAPFAEELRGVVVESTYNWYWLVDGLMEEGGYAVHLANTGAIQQYSGLKYANDGSDARWLATMLRLGILPEGYIYPKEERPVRDLLRKRGCLVSQQTSNILSIQNLVARNTGQRLSAAKVKRLEDSEIKEMLPNADLALAVQGSLEVVRCLKIQIEKIEKVVLKRARLRKEFENLLTVPGIGTILGLTIMLEVGDIGRFPSVGDFASYARCVKSTHLSNGKKKGSGNRKNGNRYLGWAFMEAAGFACRYHAMIQRYGQRKGARSHVMVARKAVAHKLARACYHILREQTVFDVDRAFG